MRSVIALMVLLTASLAGCVTVDSRYSIEVWNPAPDVCFVVLQWQTRWDESPEWNEKVTQMARQAIDAELTRLDLPRRTMDMGKPTMYEGGSVVFDVIAGDMPEPELRAKAKQMYRKASGLPQASPPVYVGKGSIRLP